MNIQNELEERLSHNQQRKIIEDKQGLTIQVLSTKQGLSLMTFLQFVIGNVKINCTKTLKNY